MGAKSLKLGTLYRDYRLDKSAIDEKARTVQLAFASETPVRRWFGNEVLEVTRDAMDMSRLKDGAALLRNHDPDQLIGVVENAQVDADKIARAVVRFGTSPLAEEAFQDVRNGILTKVSFGYTVNKVVRDGEEDGVETFRITRYTPLEISMVAVPADASCGVARGKQTDEVEIEIQDSPMKRNILLEANPAGGGGTTAPAAPAAPSVEVIERDAFKKERLRVTEIQAISKTAQRNNPAAANEIEKQSTNAIDSGMSEEAFRKAIFTLMFPEAKEVREYNPVIGMDSKEIKRYSLFRAIRLLADRKPLDGLELECSRAVEKNTGRQARGFFLPHDVMQAPGVSVPHFNAEETRKLEEILGPGRAAMLRANLATNVFTAGGSFVGVDQMFGSFIELLRNKAFVMAMGATSLTGLQGNCAIPSQTGGATAYWLAENGTTTATNQATGQVSLSPKRLAAATAFTKQLLAQSSVDVEAFVRNDLLRVLAIEKDRAALAGIGNGGEPLGIINTPSLSTTVGLGASGTTITYANALTAEANIATNNADMGALGFLATPTVRSKTKAVARFSNTDTPVWSPTNEINGYPARATNQLPSTTPFIFGNWNDLVIADWDGVDIVVDPYSLVLVGQIQVVINILTDVAIRHAKSFLLGVQA